MAEPHTPAGSAEHSVLTFVPVIATAGRFLPLLRVFLVTGLVVGIAAYLLTPALYRSSGSFFIESSADANLGSGVAAIAGRFGVGSQGKTADLMADLATSDRILIGAIQDSTDFLFAGRSLFRLLAKEAASKDDSLLAVVSEVRSSLDVSVRSPSGLVQLYAHHPDSAVSRLIAFRVLSELKRFDLLSRNSRGGEKVEFFRGRLAEAREALRSAEEARVSFVRSNRQWQQSADLSLINSQLERQVAIAQQEYVAMSAEVQRARLEQESKLAGLVVVDDQFGITRRSSRPRIVRLLAGFLLVQVVGGLLSAALVGLELSAARGDLGARQVLARLRSTRGLSAIVPR